MSQAAARELEEERAAHAAALVGLREPHAGAVGRLRAAEERRLEELRDQHRAELRRRDAVREAMQGRTFTHLLVLQLEGRGGGWVPAACGGRDALGARFALLYPW